MNILPISEMERGSLDSFDCGNEKLNLYLKAFALQNSRKNISKTFVLEDRGKTLGYYSLSSAQIRFDEADPSITQHLPRYPIPSIRLARLAVAKDEQRKGIGSRLLKDAFLRIVSISEQTGVCFVVVDVKEEAKGFYEHFGFLKTRSDSSTDLLCLSTIKKALQKSGLPSPQ